MENETSLEDAIETALSVEDYPPDSDDVSDENEDEEWKAQVLMLMTEFPSMTQNQISTSLEPLEIRLQAMQDQISSLSSVSAEGQATLKSLLETQQSKMELTRDQLIPTQPPQVQVELVPLLAASTQGAVAVGVEGHFPMSAVASGSRRSERRQWEERRGSGRLRWAGVERRRITDRRDIQFELEPKRMVPNQELLNRGQTLRNEAQIGQ